MILNAVCLVHGPGIIGVELKDGVLYFYTEQMLEHMPENANSATYEILPGYNKFYLGEEVEVRRVVNELFPDHKIEEVEV